MKGRHGYATEGNCRKSKATGPAGGFHDLYILGNLDLRCSSKATATKIKVAKSQMRRLIDFTY